MREDVQNKFNENRGHGKVSKFPRNNKQNKFNEDAALEFEDSGPKRQSMRKARDVADHHKNTARNWAFMRRLIGGNVGRPWDEVFSEICENSSLNTQGGQDLRWWIEHICVETRCKTINGLIYSDRGYSMINHYVHQDEFYVHPETGILCRAEYESWTKDGKLVRPKVLELDGTFYHEHEGTWYRVMFKKWEIETWDEWNTHEKKYIRRKGYHPNRILVDVFLGYRKNRLPKKKNYYNVYTTEKKYDKDEDGDFRICIWKQSADGREIDKLKKKYQWN
jgi:hypothetical protein